jgi:metallophosphoesterase superfamily enzyme
MQADQIVAAIRALRLNPSACLVIVPGDVAFSGKAEEYRLAQQFFRELLTRLEQEYPGIKPEIAFVPGNHDCNMKLASDIRNAGQIHSVLEKVDINGAFVREYLAVQEPFFEFTKAFGQVQETSGSAQESDKHFIFMQLS